MMSTPRPLIEKDVSFLGVWKANRINDNLMKQIASIAKSKKGYRSRLVLLPDSVKLYVQTENGFGGKHDLIPIDNLYDITLNTFNHSCIMCVKSNAENRLEVFACRCHSDTDSKQVVHSHSEYKMTKSGVGYNQNIRIPDGLMWSLHKPRQKVIRNGNIVVRNGDFPLSADPITVSNGAPPTMVDSAAGEDNLQEVHVTTTPISEKREDTFHGKTVYHIAVQTDDFDDTESTMSTASSKMFREELLSLSRELKEIKFLLERSTGISAQEFFQKERDETLKKVPEPDNHISYADIRSYGVQTEGRHSKYIKRKNVASRLRSKSRERPMTGNERVSKWTVSKPIQNVYGHEHSFQRNFQTTRSMTMPSRGYRLPSDNSEIRL